MGKKYIVNLMDETQIIVEVGANSTGAALIASNPISALTPYTEPDIEQVRKEAYQKGYETGYEDGYNEPGKNQQEAYQRGLADAWEAARKISLAKIDGGFSWESMNNMFGTDSPSKIYKTFTASEAIEKIRQYEQEKDRQARIEYNFDEIKDVLETTAKECNVSLDEIAEVLQKMKETDNG